MAVVVVVVVVVVVPPGEDVFIQPLLGIKLDRREQRMKSREVEMPILPFRVEFIS